MAALSLFEDINKAAVTSFEKTVEVHNERIVGAKVMK